MKNKKKKLIAGIVLTGGGSQLNHLKQLVEYITGMDTRVGYPNEHLAGDSDGDITSPLFATAVGLVLDGLERQEKQIAVYEAPQDLETSEPIEEKPPVRSKGFLEKLTERLKDFLENQNNQQQNK